MFTKRWFAITILIVLLFSSLTGCGSGGGDQIVSTGATSTTTATVTGLDPHALYYFAVSAYNGASSPCSNEVQAAASPSGTVSLIWNGVSDSTVSAYDVHYGKQSPEQHADCSYSDVLRVPVSS